MANVLIDTLKSVMTGKAPAKQVDPRLSALEGSLGQGLIVDAMKVKCGNELAKAAPMLERMTALYHEINTVNTEAAGCAKYAEQQARAAERAKAGETADPEDTWAQADFIEEQTVTIESKRDAAQSIGRDLAPLRVKITDAFAEVLGQEIQAIEASNAATHAAFNVAYQPSALVITLRATIDLVRAASPMSGVLKSILDACNK